VSERETYGNAYDDLGASPGLETVVAGSDSRSVPATRRRSGKPGAIELLLEPWSAAGGLAELDDEVVDLGGLVAAGGELAHLLEKTRGVTTFIYISRLKGQETVRPEGRITTRA
jgi:hypothetical protein